MEKRAAIRQLVGQTAIYGLSSFVPRFLNYLLVPIYTRIFEPAEYGIVAELYAYVTFLIIILTYGMETGYFRFSSKSERPEHVYNVITTSLIITSILFILATNMFAGYISGWIEYRGHPEYIKWFGIILGIDAFVSLPFARLRYENKPMKFAMVKIFNVLINIGFVLFFLIICPKIKFPGSLSWVYDPGIGVGYIFISNLIASACTLVILYKEIIKIRIQLDYKLWKSIIIYSFPLLIAGLAGNINEAMDRVLIKYLVPDGENPMVQLGVYAANAKLAIIMVLFIQMFRYAFEPFIFQYEKDRSGKELYADILKYFSIFCIVIFLVVTFYLHYFKYFIGEKYWAGLDIVPVMLLANIFLGIYFNLSLWYKLKELTRFGAYFAISGALITLVLNFIFIPLYGYIAPAWVRFACYFVMVFLSYNIGKRYYPVPYALKSILVYFLIGSLFFIVHLGISKIIFYQWIKDIFYAGIIFGFIIFVLSKEHSLRKLIQDKWKSIL